MRPKVVETEKSFRTLVLAVKAKQQRNALGSDGNKMAPGLI